MAPDPGGRPPGGDPDEVTGVETLARPVGGVAATARRVAPAAREWLRSARPARALHVFDRAAYLVDDRGAIVLLAAAPAPMGPFTISARLDVGSLLHVMDVGDTASVLPGRLSVGRLTVRTEGALAWESVPDWPATRSTIAARAAQLAAMRKVLRDETRRGIFASRVTDESGADTAGFDARLTARAAKTADDVLRALRSSDMARLSRASAGLAGLGTGFTPSGDDFLMGAIFSFWTVLPAESARRISRVVLQAAAPRTTPASGAWLAAAARGEAAEPWHRMVASLAVGRHEAVQAASRAILRTGHTSGEDALIGFVCGIASLSDSPSRQAAPEERRS
jgi:hypothetical protein